MFNLTLLNDAMFLCIGLPHKKLNRVPENTSLALKTLQLQPLKLKSLDDVVQCQDRVQTLTTKVENTMSAMFSTFKNTFLEQFKSSEMPKNLVSFEEQQFNNLKVDDEETTMEGLVEILEGEFLEIENHHQEQQKKYFIAAKKFETLEKKLHGGIKEVCLNAIVPVNNRDEIHVFLQPYYAIVGNESVDEFLQILSRNKYFSSSLSERVEIDFKDEHGEFQIIKFYGLKPLDEKNRIFLNDNKIVLKEFVPEDVFAKDKTDFEEVKKFKHEYCQYLKDVLNKIFMFYSRVCVAKVYVDSILVYGLPCDFNILCVQSKKEHRVLEYVRIVCEQAELSNQGHRCWKNITMDELLTSPDVAAVQFKFRSLEED